MFSDSVQTLKDTHVTFIEMKLPEYALILVHLKPFIFHLGQMESE